MLLLENKKTLVFEVGTRFPSFVAFRAIQPNLLYISNIIKSSNEEVLDVPKAGNRKRRLEIIPRKRTNRFKFGAL